MYDRMWVRGDTYINVDTVLKSRSLGDEVESGIRVQLIIIPYAVTISQSKQNFRLDLV